MWLAMGLPLLLACCYFMLQAFDQRAETPRLTVDPAVRSTGVAAIEEPKHISSASLAESASLPKTPRVGLSTAFYHSNDYLQFVRSVFPAARGGNSEAQYYLARALEYCADGYRMYFAKRTLDQALLWASTRQPGANAAEVQIVYDRCHALMDQKPDQWGISRDWLGKATEAGLPEAQALTASKLLLGALVTSDARGSLAVVSQEQDPHVLLRRAIPSRKPEVLFQVGDLQGLLNPARDRKIDQEQPGQRTAFADRLTWWWVACERGFDCEADVDWHRRMCQVDTTCEPGESGLQYLRRQGQLNNVFDLEQRAKELSAKLDAGAWDELGLGLTDAPSETGR